MKGVSKAQEEARDPTSRTPQEWSQKDLVHIIRRETSIFLRQRQKELLDATGVLALQGAVEFIDYPDQIKALIDNVDIGGFLKANVGTGTKIRIIVVQLGDEDNGY